MLSAGLSALTTTAASATPAGLSRMRALQAPHAGLVHKVAVLGRDERRMLDDRQKALRDRIGVLVHQGTNSVCTAFCVAPDIVATAGHCVVGTSSQPGSRPWLLRFRRDTASEPGIPIAGATTTAAYQHIVTGAQRLNTRPPINATSDWALLRLAAPACPAGGLPLTSRSAPDIAASAADSRVYHVAYHRDLEHWRLAVATGCRFVSPKEAGDPEQIARDFEKPDDLMLHTCDTDAASSGSPLLMDGANGPEVVGINVGTYVRSRVIMHDGEVVKRLESEVVANTALIATPLADEVRALAQRDILQTASDVRRLQMRLAAYGLYDGEIDGLYGPITRRAIESYEAHHKLPVAGLATRTLLDRMEGDAGATAAR